MPTCFMGRNNDFKKISYSINLFNEILSLLQNEINMPKERHIKNPILSKVRKKNQLISENLWILFSRVDIKQKKLYSYKKNQYLIKKLIIEFLHH